MLSSLRIRIHALLCRKPLGGNGEQIFYVDAVTKTLFVANWIFLVSQGFSYVWYSELLRTADGCEDSQGRIKLC